MNMVLLYDSGTSQFKQGECQSPGLIAFYMPDGRLENEDTAVGHVWAPHCPPSMTSDVKTVIAIYTAFPDYLDLNPINASLISGSRLNFRSRT